MTLHLNMCMQQARINIYWILLAVLFFLIETAPNQDLVEVERFQCPGDAPQTRPGVLSYS